MRLKRTSVFTQIQLSGKDGAAKVPNEIQILRTGKFNHPEYGKFEITERVLSEMVKNFNANVRGIEMSFDYYHESGKDASAWVGNLETRANGSELWATDVEWTPVAEKKLAEKELKYFSPDFAFTWKDPESGATYNNVLFGGGLTNRPFVKEMKAITAAEKEGENMKTELEIAQDKIKETEAANVKLTEELAEAKKLAFVPGGMAPPLAPGMAAAPAAPPEDFQKKCAELTAQLAEAQKQIAALNASKQMEEKVAAFNVLLTEGKACAAQKEAFISGDMTAFVKLAQPVNTKGFGSTKDAPAPTGGELEDQIIALAENKRTADPKLTVGDAIKLARGELIKK